MCFTPDESPGKVITVQLAGAMNVYTFVKVKAFDLLSVNLTTGLLMGSKSVGFFLCGYTSSG